MTEQFIIHKYLPVPYKHMGRSMAGLDCYGLIIAIYADLGIKLFDIEEDYTPDWSFKNKNYFLENAHKDWVSIEKAEMFDVVLFKNGKDIIYHAGIMLDNNRFINSCKAGTVVFRISDAIWAKRFYGFYHHKGLSIK